MKRPSLRTTIILGFSSFFLVLVIIAFFTVKESRKIINNDQQITRLQNTIENLKFTLSLMVDIETGQRGYILTGKAEFLEPYENAIYILPPILISLKKGIKDSEGIRGLVKLEYLIEKKIMISSTAIELRRKTQNIQPALKMVESGKGRILMNQIRKEVYEVELREKVILQKMRANLENNLRKTFKTVSIGLGFALIFLILGAFFLIRSISIPISELLKAANRIGSGELNYRLLSVKDNELGKLGESFNKMSQRLNQLMANEKKTGELLEQVAFASVHIGSEAIYHAKDPKNILQIITDQSRKLTGADFAALGIGTDPNSSFDPWVFSGMDENASKAIGRFPKAVGLLGWVSRQGQSIRLDDLNINPLFGGFPKDHPPMGPFLGVPIRFKGNSIGNMYLTKRPGSVPFTEQEQRATELLTAHSGVVIENSRLHNELQRAVTGREDLLAIVSHDLKNPLSSIKLNAQLLNRKTTSEEEGSLIRKQTDSIQASSDKMLRMITGLLDAAAIESGKIQLNISNHNAHDYFIQLENQFRPLAESKGLLLQVSVPPEGTTFRCDIDRIDQVLSNLIGNALKFTSKGGSIRVSYNLEANKLGFSVSDTGAGISKEDQEHLFDRYWQIKGTKQRGSGLGLFIVKGIIDAHGEKVVIQSTLGIGTSFSFDLPIANSEYKT